MKQEFTVKPISGYFALLIAFLFIGGAIAGFAFEIIWLGVVLTLLFIFTIIGFHSCQSERIVCYGSFRSI